MPPLMKDPDIKVDSWNNQIRPLANAAYLGIRSSHRCVPRAITAENTGVIFTARDAVAAAIGASGVDPPVA